MNSHLKRIAFVTAGFFVLVGTYNAVVINSESHISEGKFIKRLDEIYGVTTPGREVAAVSNWKKLSPSKVVVQNQIAKSLDNTSPSAPEAVSFEAPAVQEELSLSLVEVINPTKWQNGVPQGQFNGSLSANNGVIESLAVTLPGGEGVSVSFSEMTGNVFEYDLNGELYSGMMYQVDQNAYMVTLTNGPLEGTRLRFSSSEPAVEQQETQNLLAENNVEAGTFGAEPMNPDMLLHNDQELPQENMQAQGFNFQNVEAL